MLNATSATRKDITEASVQGRKRKEPPTATQRKMMIQAKRPQTAPSIQQLTNLRKARSLEVLDAMLELADCFIKPPPPKKMKKLQE